MQRPDEFTIDSRQVCHKKIGFPMDLLPERQLWQQGPKRLPKDALPP